MKTLESNKNDLLISNIYKPEIKIDKMVIELFGLNIVEISSVKEAC